jgi:hypothetical protein
MRFTTEEQLVTEFANQFARTRATRWAWIREFTTSSGIADLVGVDLVEEIPNRELLAGIPSKWAYTLHRLPTTVPFYTKDLAALANVSHSAAQSALRRFCDSGYCKRVEMTDEWIKTAEPKPVATRIVAVEAKLRDWRRALYQASQHSTYATQSWVVVDGMELHNVSFHVDDFIRRGVGLAGLSTNGHCEILVDAKENIPKMPTRFWQANAEIARRLAARSL